MTGFGALRLALVEVGGADWHSGNCLWGIFMCNLTLVHLTDQFYIFEVSSESYRLR